MKRFALAYFNLYDNELEIHFMRGESDVAVALKFLESKNWEIKPDEHSMEALKSIAFDGDALIDVREVLDADFA